MRRIDLLRLFVLGALTGLITVGTARGQDDATETETQACARSA